MQVRSWARDRVPALTGLLTAVALALVFGSVLGVVPTPPRAPTAVLEAIPAVNAVVSLAAIVAIVTGWRAIRRGEVRRHRAAMLTAFGLFALFLTLYLYRVSILGPSEFPGPETVYTFVYLPFLAIHILLAIVCVPLLFYVILLGTTRPVRELYDTNHARVGKIAASLWLVSFTMGITVFLMLYVVPW
ncbi:DUF420 domain-containing protein [Halorarius halobius]|uniref:DUF420 domain-containing protein n=1 Tax=Halorarius halobius TaxID=2962671 RepID=UPI0020CDD61E|nr:DUF420 domain-containing protein [Halorarius halobius]